MGLELKITHGKKEINLTDFTIVDFNHMVDDIKGRNEFLARNIQSLEIFGCYSLFNKNDESMNVFKFECWAKKTAHDKSVYRKVKLTLKDNNDEIYNEIKFKKGFVVKFSEGYNSEKGMIEFYALIREFNDEILAQDGKSVKGAKGSSTTDAPSTSTIGSGDGEDVGNTGVLGYTSTNGKEETKEFSNPLLQSKIVDGDTYALVRESKANEFVTFYGDTSYNKGSSYGGDQGWYNDSTLTSDPSKTRMDTGCGSIALSNILLYYAQNYSKNNRNGIFYNLIKDKNGKAITPNTITTQEFTEFAEGIYKEIGQTFPILNLNKGVWFIEAITGAIKRYCEVNNVQIYSKEYDNSELMSIKVGGGGMYQFTQADVDRALQKSFEKAVQFIEAGLKEDYPVVLFVRFNNYARYLGKTTNVTDYLHYVLITKSVRKMRVYGYPDPSGHTNFTIDTSIPSELEDCSLVISTWGKRNEIISFRSLWEDSYQTMLLKPDEQFYGKIICSVCLAYYPVGYAITPLVVDRTTWD